MAIVTHKCPHCLTDHIGLQIVYSEEHQHKRFLHLACPRCHHPAGTIAYAGHNARSWSSIGGSGVDITDHGWVLGPLWPQVAGPNIPENLPPDVERVYLQGERNFPIEGNEEAAGTMYRKALDVGLKKVDSTLDGMLGQKIRKLTAVGKLTPDLAEWSNSIRDLGNDAVHEESPITRAELESLRNFSEMVLRYLFSLPGAVKKRRGEKLDWE